MYVSGLFTNSIGQVQDSQRFQICYSPRCPVFACGELLCCVGATQGETAVRTAAADLLQARPRSALRALPAGLTGPGPRPAYL